MVPGEAFGTNEHIRILLRDVDEGAGARAGPPAALHRGARLMLTRLDSTSSCAKVWGSKRLEPWFPDNAEQDRRSLVRRHSETFRCW